jgi:hypothetical protein
MDKMISVTTVGTGLVPVVVGGAGVGVVVDCAIAAPAEIERMARASGRQSFGERWIIDVSPS